MARILVVDDEPSMRLLLQYMLRSHGHEVDTVERAADVFARLSEHRYDLLVSDLRMPQLDGTGLLVSLEDRTDAVPPVLMITAGGQEVDHDRLHELGAVEVLSKPVGRQELADAVDRALAG